MVVVTAPAELLLFEVLIPWAWLRWFLFSAAVCSIIWFVGLVTGPMTSPHRVSPFGVTLHKGPMFRLDIPWGNILNVTRDTSEGTAAFLTTDTRANIAITLHRAMWLDTEKTPVETIRVTVDDADCFLATTRRYMQLASAGRATIHDDDCASSLSN